MTAAQETTEHAISLACTQAGLSGVQREVVLLHLVDTFTVKQIRFKLHLGRVSEVRGFLVTGLNKLSALPYVRALAADLTPTSRPRPAPPTEAADEASILEYAGYIRFLLSAMRGPRRHNPATPHVGDTWVEVCFLPGSGKTGEVVVPMSAIGRANAGCPMNAEEFIGPLPKRWKSGREFRESRAVAAVAAAG